MPRSQGLTQAELAERTGMDQPALSRMERGLTAGMDYGVLDRLCVALGCKPGKLLERVDKAGRKKRKR